MIVETGQYALVLALALSLMQSILPFWGARTHDARLMGLARPIALTQFAFVAMSYAALTYAHVVSDFSLVNVVQNSASTKPLIYKISGVWGNHEGSMMLWVLILTLSGAAMAAFSRAIPPRLLADALSVQGVLGMAFLLFILLTSNPFARMIPAPIEGNDLNPILQDPGLAIHPPLLYLGYVGFSIVFSLAAAALIGGRLDAAFARFIRPWTLAAWCFLTLGIAMGSYWAYYTLGWGGFWFWDPVENASLMPWLAGTALLHSAAVMEKREALKVWTVFLAIVTFSLSLLGTFLVRSGVLTSVHAFASDPRRGLFILAILVLFIGGALFLFMLRASSLKQGGLFSPISREGALVVNNLLLTAACAAVIIGTLYPLALESINGDKISVGAPFFNLTFGPLFAPILLLAPLGQLLAWKRGDLLAAAQRLFFAAACGLAAMAVFAAVNGAPVMAVIGSGVAVYLIIGAFTDIFGRVFPSGLGATKNALFRAKGLRLSAWGTTFAHAGLGVTLLGLAATGWGAEKIVAMKQGDIYDVGPYKLEILALTNDKGPNYNETIAHMTVKRDGHVVALIAPSKRFFTTRRMATAQAGIVTLNLGQVYVSIAEPQPNGLIDARLFWKPLVSLIWIGALLMAFGGALSLSDRRLRVGVARRAARISDVAQAAAE
ncbi:heme lyase CcmF/NrfE family subunit [Rhodoblastus acidophilus]|uniref:Heme lyase CcmF/NrfE family subunit n=1 Tax=Candidatus Rhodoblastus alkanivorans TaxID=2954117 RepID=A0ABS9Z6A1_9HYPH|nr:heme lyase CcmF/NrfE family subunit [Candidatus Rhodoblastus alkanivorans]MCI4678773.1 heme lyase CcmF/NrfE family subunit [Candidatus Rhodoblastus alkanivorans]MCI4682162.1 heme lyase CcmF/NrfE family subunit [Candidatus Rhodoblastus alkanivorans]MDI4639464.1 heme lyase CcmF/NrfE family subunit [Rhodoblastus acidophilus]